METINIVLSPATVALSHVLPVIFTALMGGVAGWASLFHFFVGFNNPTFDQPESEITMEHALWVAEIALMEDIVDMDLTPWESNEWILEHDPKALSEEIEEDSILQDFGYNVDHSRWEFGDEYFALIAQQDLKYVNEETEVSSFWPIAV